jgi:transketolase
VQGLVELAAADERLVLLTGDLGFMALEPFIERFPDRFFNVGVAEQNMVGIATGLAEDGLVPYCYSIATFMSLRAYEFVRNGPVLHDLPVRLVGVGGGFEYGSAGHTHHALEDIGVMRLQHGLAVIAPADHCQTTTALPFVHSLRGPAYLRIGKDDKRVVDGLEGRFELGRTQLVREGNDLAIFAMGAIAIEAVAAAGILAGDGIYCAVHVVASIKPPPVDDIVSVVGTCSRVMTVEAHVAAGGLGSLVAEVVADRGLACTVARRGVDSAADGISGSEAYLHQRHGLDRESLADCARSLCSEDHR